MSAIPSAVVDGLPDPAAVPPARSSRTRQVIGATWGSPTGRVGLIMLAVTVLLAVFGPFLVGTSPTHQNLMATNEPPSWLGGGGGLLGTDSLGRDVLSRAVHGLRLSLMFGLGVATASAVLGLGLGLLAGYEQRFAGPILLRVADIQFALPFVVVGLALTAVMGPGILKLAVVLSIWGWTVYARTIVSSVAQVCRMDYITAARTHGTGAVRLLLRHVAPNVLGPVVVLWTTSAGVMILVESSLSLLGLGAQPPSFSLGTMLGDATTQLRLAWWAVVSPGVVLLWIVLAFNLTGDGLRDALSSSGRIEHDPELV
ncbi:ABC transporter permease [Kineosporia sp. NBRC 101731]|uniref:ABC transporter permease n=1 Tax=Kineosporia sp. NBRC 101731 TaxID=3032199 RepID=UPI0024A5C720|nr:ABC transporter permease [Kineosporia sp. NBRC 101731]GLY29636.1 ABC transporter permease [Kineosporia sp. NBRC 101731]